MHGGGQGFESPQLHQRLLWRYLTASSDYLLQRGLICKIFSLISNLLMAGPLIPSLATRLALSKCRFLKIPITQGFQFLPKETGLNGAEAAPIGHQSPQPSYLKFCFSNSFTVLGKFCSDFLGCVESLLPSLLYLTIDSGTTRK